MTGALQTRRSRKAPESRRRPAPAPGDLQTQAALEQPALAFQRVAAENPSPARPSDLLALQRAVGNQTVQHLLEARVQRQPVPGLPARPALQDVAAAAQLYQYLAGSRSQRSTLGQKLRVVRRHLASKSPTWLRGVERSYNHRPPHNLFLILNYQGTPNEYGHWQAEGKRPVSESPLRRDLQAALGGRASGLIAALESATRLKPLSAKETGAATLSPAQRAIAISRSQGRQRLLAQWLFDPKTWTYLVGNASKWSPTSRGGFFQVPGQANRINWPQTRDDRREGDKVYLVQIAQNIMNLQKAIDELRSKMCASRVAGFIGAGEASQAVQWAYAQTILEYREALQPLRKHTAPGVEKVMPLRFVWGPAPKNTREMCKVK